MYDLTELNQKKLLTVDEAAFYMGVCKSNMRNIISQPDFPALVRIGHKRGRVFINRDKLDEWLDENTGR